MRYLFFFIAAIFALFLNSQLATFLGFEKLMTVGLLPIMIYIAITLFTQKVRYEKEVIYIIVLAIFILIFKWAIGQNYIITVTKFLFIPMLLSICFENLNKKEISILRWVVFIFFIAEIFLAIVEWILNINFMYYTSEYWFNLGFFRSTSFLGHPLQNAQAVAVFMAFVAISNFKNKFFQIILFLLGYVSLFCFNARAATLVTTVFIVPYFIWKINKTAKPKMRQMINIGVFCLFLSMFYLVTETKLGGRLMNMELMDGSGQTRTDVFKFYTFYQSKDDFLWGHPDLYYYMMDKLNAKGVENGVITLILDYGIIFTIFILLLLFRFQYHKLSVYPKLEKWLLLAVFFIIGSVNPNLARPIQWILWIFLYYALRENIRNGLPDNVIKYG